MKMNHFIKTFVGIVALAATVTACTDDADELLQQVQKQEEGVSPFTRDAIDPTTVEDFRRTYGVGFSYDALYGTKCDMKDIHCQVLDYAAVQAALEKYGQRLLRASKNSHVYTCENYSFDKSEYTQNMYFQADAEGNLIMVNGSAEANVSIWESGEVNKFYCESRYDAQAMTMQLDYESVKELVVTQKHTELLSKNFQEAVDWLAKHQTDAVVDSFIMRYGTHLVTSSKIGGSLIVNIRMELDSVLNVIDVKALGEVTAMEMVKYNSSSEKFKKELTMLNSADCQVTIKGGDLSKIPNDMLHFTFGKRPKLDTYVASWVATLNYDINSPEKSNMEIIDMEVEPIWDFIPNAAVADRVKKRVVGTASTLIKEQGYQNGVTTEISLPQSISCKMGGQQATFQQPAMYNVIAAGRYVASVCRERVNQIDALHDVYVVYPIYDRQLNLSSGFCITGGKAYKVRNASAGFYVEEVGATKSDKVYMNLGVLDAVRYNNLTYQPSHNVIAYEWPYGLKKEGTVDTSKPYYLTYKNGLKFYLRNSNGSEQSGKLEATPNWSYDSGKKRMVRNDDYRYYWNTKEVSY